METLTDVLKYILTLAPVREESDLSKGLQILEDAREKLDGLVAKTVEVGQAIEVKDDAPKVQGL